MTDQQSTLATARLLWQQGKYQSAVRAFSQIGSDQGRIAYAQALTATNEVSLALDVISQLSEPSIATAFLGWMYGQDLMLGQDAPADPGWALATPQHPLSAMTLGGLRALRGEPGTVLQNADPRYAATINSCRWLAEWKRSSGNWGSIAGTGPGLLNLALEQAPEHGIRAEFGVYHGRSLNQIARASNNTVHGFDSFEGLPEAWKTGEGAGSYSTGGQLPESEPNVELHPGWFDDTLGEFFQRQNEPVAFAHIDCDIYSSTATVLKEMVPHLAPGSIVVFDDFLGYPGFEQHELRAFKEICDPAHWSMLGFALLGREVAFRYLGDRKGE